MVGRYGVRMFTDWDVFDFIGWGALAVVLLLVAALVTYLVKSWGKRGRAH